MTWFLKPDGSPLASIPGYIEAVKFTRALEYVQERTYENEESESDFGCPRKRASELSDESVR